MDNDELINRVIIFQNKTFELFYEIGSKLVRDKKIIEFQIMTDQDFEKRKDKIFNNIHLFLITKKNNIIFHLMAYCEINVTHYDDFYSLNKISLTGYKKRSIELHNGYHSLEQKWYNIDSDNIVEEIISQNQDLFNID